MPKLPAPFWGRKLSERCKWLNQTWSGSIWPGRESRGRQEASDLPFVSVEIPALSEGEQFRTLLLWLKSDQYNGGLSLQDDFSCLRHFARRFWNQTCIQCNGELQPNQEECQDQGFEKNSFSHLDSSLGKIQSNGQFFSFENVRVMCLFKCSLQLMKLKSSKCSSWSSNFSWLVLSIFIVVIITWSVIISIHTNYIFFISWTGTTVFLSIWSCVISNITVLSSVVTCIRLDSKLYEK